MDKVTIQILNNNKTVIENKGVTLEELSSKYFEQNESTLVCNLNNEVVDLSRKVLSDSTVEFQTIKEPLGFRAYQTSALFLLIASAKEHFGMDKRVIVKHSIGKNLYVEVKNVVVTEDDAKCISKIMHDKVENNVVIEKSLMTVKNAMEVSKKCHLDDKVDILKYRRGSSVNMYCLDGFYDYFYGAMVLQLNKIKLFDVKYVSPNLVLQLPDISKENELTKIKDYPKISEVFEEAKNWQSILEIDTVGKLNKKIIDGNFLNVIRLSESLHEKKLSIIADEITQKNKKLVLIAGPSSSGKTTFAHRLSDHLRVCGKKPHIISLDDYYLERKDIPFEEDGTQNFEVVESLDIEMINRDVEKILKGECVEIPSFNFVLGVKEYKGRTITLKDDDIIIMEGIHGLNDVITKSVSKDDKYKIFISALTTLNIDDHNRISTSDNRLIRRIVRDHSFRGFTAETTIAMWQTVLKGEVENIFPYQNEADQVFNSALVYELSVLKQYVEPLLFDIDPAKKEYKEARRIIKFLENFLVPVDPYVPATSIAREFIGGGIFF